MKLPLRLLAIALLPSLMMAGNAFAAEKSLFDRLAADHIAAGKDIPFPFPRLLETLQLRLGFAPSDQVWAKILIPRGRSLHREAASPEYYQFPRIVVALDQDGPNAALIKNRLFLGYQERAESIEIISYNETDGRFEFQVIENYGVGKKARLFYPNRALCTGCHQNEAPIFPKPLWGETNFNPEVATKIAAHHQRYQGIGIGTEYADADRIDFATDQASLLSVYQAIWQQGCPDNTCRANLLHAALLRATRTVDSTEYAWSPLERRLLDTLQSSWARTWPEGLPIAGADIEDRISTSADDPLTAAHSPTTQRAPLAYWSARTAAVRALEGIVDQFLPSETLDRLRDHQTLNQHSIDVAIRQLQNSADTAPLFNAKPIPGPQLMQALFDIIGARE